MGYDHPTRGLLSGPCARPLIAMRADSRAQHAFRRPIRGAIWHDMKLLREMFILLWPWPSSQSLWAKPGSPDMWLCNCDQEHLDARRLPDLRGAAWAEVLHFNGTCKPCSKSFVQTARSGGSAFSLTGLRCRAAAAPPGGQSRLQSSAAANLCATFWPKLQFHA